MSAGCVPVVTAVGFLPVLVGDTGFLVEYGDEAAAGRAIACALESDGGVRARERVRRLYSLEKREQALLRRVERLVTGS
jgi:glycosyltransferase involved in cell wall biosynthesis